MIRIDCGSLGGLPLAELKLSLVIFFVGCVHFIDHEYAMYNYEHFEIGNHFCEYAGMQFSLKETSKICTDDILMFFFIFHRK